MKFKPNKMQQQMAKSIALHRKFFEEQQKRLKESCLGSEFATLHLSFGRAAGHTTYILNNAQNQDIVLFRNVDQLSLFRSHFQHHPLLLSVSSIQYPEKWTGMRADILWIDGLGAYEELLKDYISFYQFLYKVRPHQIVVLGM